MCSSIFSGLLSLLLQIGHLVTTSSRSTSASSFLCGILSASVASVRWEGVEFERWLAKRRCLDVLSKLVLVFLGLLLELRLRERCDRDGELWLLDVLLLTRLQLSSIAKPPRSLSFILLIEKEWRIRLHKDNYILEFVVEKNNAYKKNPCQQKCTYKI